MLFMYQEQSLVEKFRSQGGRLLDFFVIYFTATFVMLQWHARYGSLLTGYLLLSEFLKPVTDEVTFLGAQINSLYQSLMTLSVLNSKCPGGFLICIMNDVTCLGGQVYWLNP